MLQVWELLYNCFAEMGLLNQVGEVVAGTTTTVQDTTLSLDTNVKAGGTIMIFQTTDGGAPQGEAKRVASNTANTYTTSAFSVAPDAGDLYAYIAKDFNVYELLPLVNMALRFKCPPIPQEDTSITTALAQREYTLPVAVKAGKIYAIYEQTNTGDSDDNRWSPVYDWSIRDATAGNTGLLVFSGQRESGRKIRIVYVAPHPAVTAFTAEIHEALPMELAKASLKYQLNQSRNEEAIASQDGYRELYNASRDEYQEALKMWKVQYPAIIRPALAFGRS